MDGKIAASGVMQYHARDVIRLRFVAHRVICKEKCISCSGQSLVLLAVVHFS